MGSQDEKQHQFHNDDPHHLLSHEGRCAEPGCGLPVTAAIHDSVNKATAPESVLEEALRIIGGQRQQDYGGPRESFGRIAALWNAYLKRLDGWHDLTEHDVAMLMILLKVARARNGIATDGEPQRDSLVDIAGYAGCSGLML